MANEEKREQIEEKKCFVIMPISDIDGYRPRHFDEVYRSIIIPACQKAEIKETEFKKIKFKAHRLDERKGSDIIHISLLEELYNAPMVLCDLSTRNPNVLFELGLRVSFGKPLVVIQEIGTKQTFDTDIIRHIEYCKELRYADVLNSQEMISEAIQASFNEPNTYHRLLTSLRVKESAKLPTSDAGKYAAKYIQATDDDRSKIKIDYFKQMNSLARGGIINDNTKLNKALGNAFVEGNYEIIAKIALGWVPDFSE